MQSTMSCTKKGKFRVSHYIHNVREKKDWDKVTRMTLMREV